MSHYDIHVGDVIKYPEMVMNLTVIQTCSNTDEALVYGTISRVGILKKNLASARLSYKHRPIVEGSTRSLGGGIFQKEFNLVELSRYNRLQKAFIIQKALTMNEKFKV